MEYVWWGNTQPTEYWHHFFARNWKPDLFGGFQLFPLKGWTLRTSGWIVVPHDFHVKNMKQMSDVVKWYTATLLTHHRCILTCLYSLNTQEEEVFFNISTSFFRIQTRKVFYLFTTSCIFFTHMHIHLNFSTVLKTTTLYCWPLRNATRERLVW